MVAPAAAFCAIDDKKVVTVGLVDGHRHWSGRRTTGVQRALSDIETVTLLGDVPAYGFDRRAARFGRQIGLVAPPAVGLELAVALALQHPLIDLLFVEDVPGPGGLTRGDQIQFLEIGMGLQVADCRLGAPTDAQGILRITGTAGIGQITCLTPGLLAFGAVPGRAVTGRNSRAFRTIGTSRVVRTTAAHHDLAFISDQAGFLIRFDGVADVLIAQGVAIPRHSDRRCRQVEAFGH